MNENHSFEKGDRIFANAFDIFIIYFSVIVNKKIFKRHFHKIAYTLREL